MAQDLLRCHGERHWLRTAPRLAGHRFPRLPVQSQYNTRLRQIAPLTEAAPRWLADATPATAELLRRMDATPVPCGTSAVTAKRSDLFGHAGYGYCPSHSRWYGGAKLLLICTGDGTVTGFSLANPKMHGERDQARQTLERQPVNRPAPGTAVVTDKGLSGQGTKRGYRLVVCVRQQVTVSTVRLVNVPVPEEPRHLGDVDAAFHQHHRRVQVPEAVGG